MHRVLPPGGIFRAAILACVIGVASPVEGATPSYAAIQLPSFGGTVTAGKGINSVGEVVGFSFLPGNAALHAFRWSGGALIDLGTLGGTLSDAAAINDHGQIVGYSYLDPDVAHAFLYSGGVMMDLGTLGGKDSAAIGINNSGQVTGRSDFAIGNTDQHAFLYSGGTILDLGTLGGRASYGNGINASGQITGAANVASNPFHAFRYAGGVMQDLGIAALSSEGRAINASGQIAGALQVNAGTIVVSHAFFHSGGTTIDLDPLGARNSAAVGLNDAGTVTGYNCDLSDTCVAFLYIGGVVYDLNTLVSPPLSGIRLTLATAINNAGQIVAGGCTIASPTVCYAYRLDPILPPPTIQVSSPVAFTSVIGGRSMPQVLTLLASAGTLDVTIASIATTGEFEQTNTCGAMVISGGSCTISVVFAPRIAGPQVGSLVIAGNQVGSPTVVALQGNANAIPATAVPAVSARLLALLACVLAVAGAALGRRR